MFTDTQLLEIQHKGINPELVEKQIERFKTGFFPMHITNPASISKGIIEVTHKEAQKLIKFFNKSKKKQKMIKFVPASGAASRMFKMLYSILEEYDGSEESYNKLFSKTGMHTPAYFFEHITEFAFYDALVDVLARNGFLLQDLLDAKDYTTILTYLLTSKGLKYGELPKGALFFHQYPDAPRTAIEEHMVEGAQYAKNSNGDVFLHFTVSPEFIQEFKDIVQKTKAQYQEQYNVKFYVDYSVQNLATDTIAVTKENTPFLNADGSLLFRPAGHGALIENLNELDFDLIFIKNIDNVVPDSYKQSTVYYKKVLAGILLHYQKIIFDFYKKLKKSKHLSEKLQKKIIAVFTQELSYVFPDDFFEMPKDDRKDYLLDLLYSPIRVCGMVKNEGEPGGGPFFVKENDGSQTLQIVEMAQLDESSQEHMDIVKQATHFNPVDIVCGIKDSEGKKFNILKYVDEEAGIITMKSKDGKELKALELPGLWNGAMSHWITIFVEVPIITFNPVKEVTDLLRAEHKQL
ncbi:MAG: DUF4301 family protein [Bacteroidales bacterium]|nr:DUF4301 family protein [Bacteroidales bacterium]